MIGGCFLILVSSTNTSIQLIVADRIRGRVMSVRVMIFMFSVPIGSTVQGALAEAFGPRATIVGVGIAALVVAVAVTLLRGEVRLSRMDDPHDERELT